MLTLTASQLAARKNLVLFAISGCIFTWLIWSLAVDGIGRKRLLGARINPCDNFIKFKLATGAGQDERCLIEYVRDFMLKPPSPLPYNITNDYRTTTNTEIHRLIKKYLIEKSRGRGGFFIEVGAHDGDKLSPTLALEQDFGWTGLLIEGNPKTFKRLLTKHRKAWSINALACLIPYAQKIPFFEDPASDGRRDSVREREDAEGSSNIIDVQCIPLYTTMAAMRVDTVDFLNLDMEGAELEVLKTLPFEKVLFKMVAVDYTQIPVETERPAVELNEFFKSKGYVFLKNLVDDLIFIHGSLVDNFNKTEFDVALPE